MRRGYNIQVTHAPGEPVDPIDVSLAFSEIEGVLEKAGMSDEDVALLNRKEGRLYVTAGEEITESLVQLEHVGSIAEDEFDGYKIALEPGADPDFVERLLNNLFNANAKTDEAKVRFEPVSQGGLRSFIVRDRQPQDVDKAAKVAGVSYVMPNYKGRMAPGVL